MPRVFAVDASLVTILLLMVEFLALSFSGRYGPTGMLLTAEQILYMLHYLALTLAAVVVAFA